MRVVCMSDTHGRHQPTDVPEGDLLIHAGDLSVCGESYEVQHALAWLRNLPHKHKVFIGGNHDNALAEMFGLFSEQMKPYKGNEPLIYLRGSSVTIKGFKIFGSSALPFNPIYRTGARAYMLNGTTNRHWSLAPKCDILVTHGAPKGILDCTYGDPALRNYVQKIKPKLHVFGHIHLGHGMAQDGGTTFVNAAMIDERYMPAHEPTVVDL